MLHLSGQKPATDLLDHLRRNLRQWEQEARAAGGGRVSSGFAALDRQLPERGFRRGTLVEWLQAEPGSGAGTLALVAAREAMNTGRPLVVIDLHDQFYPPAAAQLGIDGSRTLVVRCRKREDLAWACDQALRTRGVGAVVCWTADADARWLRRWQLAAECGAAVGLLVRDASARQEPCFSEARLFVQPLTGVGRRRLQLQLVRGRGWLFGATVEVELDHETRALHPRTT